MLFCFVGILLIRLVTIQSILWNPVIEANHYLYSRKNSFHDISNNMNEKRIKYGIIIQHLSRGSI